MICNQCQTILPDKFTECPLCLQTAGGGMVNPSPSGLPADNPLITPPAPSKGSRPLLEESRGPGLRGLFFILFFGGIAAFFIRQWINNSILAEDVSFKGKWKITQTHLGDSSPLARDVDVVADKELFSLVEKTQKMHLTTVYDGKFVHSKTLYLEPSRFGGDIPSSSESSREVKPHEVGPMRFWRQPKMGKKSPGGLIAGRNAHLYQARAKRPEGDFTSQIWEDAETGVVLKSADAIYSKHVEEVVNRNTAECLEIQYQPVDPNVFNKP